MKKKEIRNVWFVNFSGIGNGIIAIPLLQCFENSMPSVGYFHIENEVLSNEWFVSMAKLKNIRGFTDISWRRFEKKDWGKILDFLDKGEINLVVNLRNEGKQYDCNYYRFKKFAGDKIMFWDFDEPKDFTDPKNIVEEILLLFKKNNIDVSSYNPVWLGEIRKQKEGRQIGFGIAGSQKNKRWPTKKWIVLCSSVVGVGADVTLFPGRSDQEIEDAKSIKKVVSECKIVKNKDLKTVSMLIGSLRCFVSNDTGLLHIASAIGIPVIGLYTNTDSNVWSPYRVLHFVAYKNSLMDFCPDRKIRCGNCFHYYDVCPAIEKYGDDIDPVSVFSLVKDFLN